MSQLPLQFFVLEREIDEWLRRFATEHHLAVLRRGPDETVRKISWGALRDDPREQPIVHLGPRSELAGVTLEKGIRSPEFVLITLPIETSKIDDPARRARVESQLCGTQRPCLLMGEITPWKTSEHQLFRAIRRELSSLAPLRVSIEAPSGARTEARGRRASVGALEWQSAGGELRQAGVLARSGSARERTPRARTGGTGAGEPISRQAGETKVRYRIEPA